MVFPCLLYHVVCSCVLTLYCLTVDLTHAYVLDEIGLFLTLAIHKIKRDEMVYTTVDTVWTHKDDMLMLVA